jgi:hypothetical protein
MAKITWDEMAISTSTATSYVDMAGSPYTPKGTGILRAVKLVLAGDAATSLIENVTVKMSCQAWGVDLVISGAGGGVRTAPAVPIPPVVQECALPVSAANPIQIQVKHYTGATPVTPRIQVLGAFEYQ